VSAEPLDGCYLYTRRDGTAALVQWTAGRPVEMMMVRTSRRPKRLTRRRLGNSITEWLREERIRRLHAAISMLTPEGWEGPSSPQILQELYRFSPANIPPAPKSRKPI
jgi:hypothetical protein